MIDKFSRECLAIRAARKLNSDCVLELLTELFTLRGVPEHVRADNGPEFTAKAVRNWLPKVGVQTLTEQWRREYNSIRPHSALGYRSAAPRPSSPGRS